MNKIKKKKQACSKKTKRFQIQKFKKKAKQKKKVKMKTHKQIQAQAIKQPNILREVTYSADFIEQRKDARLDVPLKVLYETDNATDGVQMAITKNISAGGCLLLANEKLPVNSNLELDIFLGKTESEILKLCGTIIRSNDDKKGSYEYGISFETISPNARRLFTDFCFAKMYEMTGLSEWPTDNRSKI